MAQSSPSLFPKAAVAFLDGEIPKMKKAVTEKDREFFRKANERVQSFLEVWGLSSPRPIALEQFPMCTDAVTDYVLVGLCQISPPGSVCEPATFIAKFKINLQKCRDAAKANR